MRLETFFGKFVLFADAPDGAAKMRELVLHLAFNGQLVPSNAARKVGALESILAEASINGVSKGPTSDTTATEILRISAGTSRRDFFVNEDDFKHVDLPPDNVAKFRLEPGDLLACRFNGNLRYVGRFSYYRGNSGRTQVNPDKLIRFRIDQREHSPRYICYAMNSADARTVIESMCATTAGNIGLSAGKLKTVEIPLPPLAEQKRIVAKVDELMALCDRLEAQQQERKTRHTALARASLARFAEAPTPANLNFLFHPSYTIPPADLRKSILTLAVQGKLVHQDPNDEPAEDLIARIATRRHTKKAKQYVPVTADEVPYDIPFSWSWVRLGNISLTSDSGWSPQCGSEARSGNAWGVLKVSAVSWGGFDPEANKALPPGMESRPECEVRPGDFLLSRANTEELVARSVVVDQTPSRLMMSDKIVRFTFPDDVDKAFINLANLSDPSRDYYMRNASGTSSSMKNIGRGVMCNLPIALPPLAEQRRIVAKVDQLMALVDQLGSHLAASRATAASLLEALVAELIRPAHIGGIVYHRRPCEELPAPHRRLTSEL